MTGYYVRVHRDGRYANIEIDQCTDDELEGVFACAGASLSRQWAMALARWIRDHVQEEPATEATAPPEIGRGF